MSDRQSRRGTTYSRYWRRPSDIVKIVVYDVAPGNVAAYRAVRDRMLNGHAPASTYVVVTKLASPDFLTEIEAEAVAE